jgi:arylsulfatase A-like enzyme
MYKLNVLATTGRAMMILVCAMLITAFAGLSKADEKADEKAVETAVEKALSSRFENTNVILVSLQCLRPDHMGIGGYKRDTTPNLDQISKSSVLFENSIAQTNLTPVAMMAALTGKYPRVNGMVAFDLTEGSVTARTMPEYLKLYDYKTAAVLSTPEFFLRFDGDSGNKINLRDVFSRSYDQYLWPKRKAGKSMRVLPTESLDWIDKNKDKKFFLWIAAGTMHPPYAAAVPEPEKSMFDPPGYTAPFWSKYFPIDGNEGGPDDPSIDRLLRIWDNKYYQGFKPVHDMTSDDAAYIVSRYDAGIRYTDKFLGELDKKLKETGLDKNTIVIYYSIHGKALGEKGGVFINYDLFESVVKNLLLIRFPDGQYAGRRIPEQVQGIDILPTLLNYLDIPIAADLQGVNLMPLIRGEAGAKGSEYAFIDRMPFWEHWMSRFFLEFKYQDTVRRNHPPSEDQAIDTYAKMLREAFPLNSYPPGDIAIRTNQWKLVVRKDPRLLEKVSWPAFITGEFFPSVDMELYNLVTDPWEHNNVVAENPKIAAELKAKLMAWDAENEKLKVPYYRAGEKRVFIPYP